MSGYQGRHRKHATPEELAEVSRGLAGLANLVQIVPSKNSSEE